MATLSDARHLREEVEPARVPGEPGIWVMIGGDLLVFALIFGVFAYYRGEDLAGYSASQLLLDRGFGLANTLILLTSSLFVALGLHVVRGSGSHAVAPKLFGFATLCGAAFLVSKYLEWSGHIAAGHTVISDDFFMFYFMLTGIHLLHVVIGIGVLLFLVRRSRKPKLSAADISAIECGTVFWHLVDLLWIVLFALLYLLR